MPVGPSHHRGGGSSRSHSSSSSRSSSRSSGSSRSYSSSRSFSTSRSYGSSRSHYGHGHHHHHHYYGDSYGGVEIKVSPKAFAIFGIIIGFIVTIICFAIGADLIKVNAAYHATMKSDAAEYQEIIERAAAGVDGYYEKYITNITSTGSSSSGGYATEYFRTSNNGTSQFFDDTYIEAYSEVVKNGVNYYWLEISFWSEEAGERIDCITYTLYPEAAVASLSSIRLAYTKEYDGDGAWDVINFNYSLDNNVDYWYTGRQIGIGSILIAVALGIGALMVWCCKLVHNSGKKSRAGKGSSSTSTPSAPAYSGSTSSASSNYKECSYCGARSKADSTKCSSCGSRFR